MISMQVGKNTILEHHPHHPGLENPSSNPSRWSTSMDVAITFIETWNTEMMRSGFVHWHAGPSPYPLKHYSMNYHLFEIQSIKICVKALLLWAEKVMVIFIAATFSLRFLLCLREFQYTQIKYFIIFNPTSCEVKKVVEWCSGFGAPLTLQKMVTGRFPLV